MAPETLHERLRLHARTEESPPRAAAIELLIRAGLATEGWPWIRVSDQPSPTVDFGALRDAVDGFSGSQRSLLRIAASLADALPIQLGDELTSLGFVQTQLALDAIGQAAGHGDHIRSTEVRRRYAELRGLHGDQRRSLASRP